MKPTFLSAAVALTMAVSMPSFAAGHDDRHDHFEGKAAANLAEALANLQEYNQKLAEILNGELTPQKMAEIHQLTYTLENALERIEEEIDDMQDDLEDVHKGSERMDFDKVKAKGAKYIEASNQLVKGLK
ncbi:hypothetical protein SAMN02927930_00028 [Pseudidiomarina indica]|uniref:Soluble cytochrome b562 n=1 Tax=Pseudidiomarina indica TaxID=1159017 RepID=A0A1G6A0M8_9GAMM|nr:DUF6746 family protein [Pseudidiomarina indica]SDB01776.1 hypothetical protein SAMN02927930_00028 [Pseudidiomarina indica]